MSGQTERVVRALISEVAEGRLRPGDRLPTADDLAGRFRVSEHTASAALRVLAQVGLATLSPDGTTTVAPEVRWDVLHPMVLERLLGSDHGPAILAEYLEYRRLLEVLAAGLAAERATADDLTALSRALATMTAAAEQALHMDAAEARFHEADVEFHHALIAAGGNRPLALATNPTRRALCTARRPLARPGLRLARGLPEHQRILAAVAEGDADGARAAMANHLDSVESYLREYAGVQLGNERPAG
jgi:DNA-binding FadR family transcriptional regulator